ncbi:MAG: type transport system permease protein [Trichococcus sp.]|jgi:ABC-2 type transport system permease protein|nr:type transport system permease protein [Trichococcus sp.]
MNLDNIWKKRQQLHLKKFSRYSKYIFNDHFVIVLLFLMGALAYQYSEFVKTVTPDFFWGKLLIVVVFSASIFVGKLATFLEPADQVFLLAKEKEWGSYFDKAKKYSLILPAVLLLFLAAAAMPMLFAGRTIGASDFLPIYATLILLKVIHLYLQELGLKIGERQVRQKNDLYLAFAALLAFSIGIFFNPWVAPVLVTLYTMFLHKKVQVAYEARYPLYQWEQMIASEEQRKARTNRVINLFTDVPQVKSKAKRRKYFDGLLRRVEGNSNSYQYLYARAFLRGTDYSGLFFRLLGIGMLLLVFTPSAGFSLGLSLLFLYLTGFQLLPLYFHFNENMLFRLYPSQQADKFAGFKRLLAYLLGVEGFLFAGIIFINNSWQTGLAAVALNTCFVWLFIQFYIGGRTEKRETANY